MRSVLSTVTHQWRRFRGGRLFIPALVAVPLLAAYGSLGWAVAWDSTRVNVPDLVGAPWSDSIADLADLGLKVNENELPDDSIDPNCYVVATQDVPYNSRVVPDDTVVDIQSEPDQRPVPDVVGLSLADARQALRDGCFHDEVLQTWCVPRDFSGGEAVLTQAALTEELGFVYDAQAERLINGALQAQDDWPVCDQTRAAATMFRSSMSVPVTVTVPLTTVPVPAGDTLKDALDALQHTADGCALTHSVSATFSPNPDAIRAESLPPVDEMSSWRVRSLTPTVGHAALCDSTIQIEVEWPSIKVPKLLGKHHVPETPTSETPATSAAEHAGLVAQCTGVGTVTSQVPAPGALAPIGTTVTCVAELVMPRLIGLTPAKADAVLAAAGLSAWGSGSGTVVSQSPAAGKIVTDPTGVSYEAEEKRVNTGYAFYENCTAARAAGAAPIYRGEPGYRAGLDRDGDGIACE